MAQPTLKVEYKMLEMPRELDECIMERLVKDSVRGAKLVGIKRVRKVQVRRHYSCPILPTQTKTYASDWRWLFKGTLGRHRSTLEFGLECSTDQDWVDWESALQEITTSRYYGFSQSLGKWVGRLPRILKFFTLRKRTVLRLCRTLKVW